MLGEREKVGSGREEEDGKRVRVRGEMRRLLLGHMPCLPATGHGHCLLIMPCLPAVMPVTWQRHGMQMQCHFSHMFVAKFLESAMLCVAGEKGNESFHVLPVWPASST